MSEQTKICDCCKEIIDEQDDIKFSATIKDKKTGEKEKEVDFCRKCFIAIAKIGEQS